jgi:hypothetical protein
VKKKYGIIIPILMLLEVLFVINFVNSFNCDLFLLKTNKTTYYINESIKINASWELNYDENSEVAYVQIHIMDKFNQFIWNSSKYNQIGTYKKNWTLNIKDFNLDIKNSSYTCYIKFFVFYCHKNTGSVMYNYIATEEITMIKRAVLCELTGYKERIKVGEELCLFAKFYDEDSNMDQYLINQTILFKIFFNDLVIKQANYSTNMSGVISIHLFSLTDLKLGQNFLVFSIEDNNLYNDSKFIYEIQVEKNDPIIEIINFKNNLKEHEDLEIKLYCYYYFNQSKNLLADYELSIKIFDNQTQIFVKEYETNKSGILEVSIPQKSFNQNQTNNNFFIKIVLNETSIIDKKTLTLTLNLNQDNYWKMLDLFQMKIFSFTTVLIIILILLLYVIINKRSKTEKLLTELIIRY